MQEEYPFFVPTAQGEFELVEKKSRFIGQIWQVQSEEEAKAKLEANRKRYHDARHHCWCYVIDDRLMRYSDDGEPQGTAGQPMLSVMTGEKMQQICCVVTRYFGGTLLGTGGLVRAYSHCAKGALAAAGRSAYEILREVEIICPYPLYETVQKVMKDTAAMEKNVDYGVDVTVTCHVPKDKTENFLDALTEWTAGQILAEVLGEVAELVPIPSESTAHGEE